MVERGRTRRRQVRLAALAASLAIVVTVAGLWIARGTPAPATATAGSTSRSGSISVPNKQPTNQPSEPAEQPGKQPTVKVQPAGLRLTAGHGQQAAPPVPVVAGKPLDDKQIASVIDRLPSWADGRSQSTPFRWPTQSITKPAAGKSVLVPFPAAEPRAKPDPTPAGPLHVLRMQPQGSVSVAPFVGVTFDQPMIPIATVGQLPAGRVPVTMTPKVPGSWQWIGTSSLRFAAASGPVDRLPMATDFTITVPAGTRAAGGATLARAVRATFSTPAPTVKHFQPTGQSMSVTPIFVAVFDQRVDPGAVLRAVSVTAGSRSWPVRLANAAEVAADPNAALVVGGATGRVLAFGPVRPLPKNAAVTVTFAAGVPSAEGPRATAKAVTFAGRTYASLKLVRPACGYGGTKCQPSSPLNLVFTNALDGKAFDPTAVTISPNIPGGATVTTSGQTIVVDGATQAATTYTITVPATLTDVFGQRLAGPVVATLNTAESTPRLDPFPSPVTTLDPMVADPSVTVNTVNRKAFRERVFAVSTADWPDFQRFYVQSSQQSYLAHTALTVPHWPVLIDRVVDVGGQPNRLVTTKLPLSQAMTGAGRTGEVVVVLEPTDRESFNDNDFSQNLPTITWAQSTTLGLDALNDATNLRAWVTDLRSGSPLAGVSVGLLDGDGKTDPRGSATTGADGIAALRLPVGGAGALLATRGTQSALLPSEMWANSWTMTPTSDRLLWFVTDDRQTYRPGETVSVKGWVRRQSSDVAATLTAPTGASVVSYTAQDADGVTIGHGTAKISKLGGFDLTVRIPAGANLGAAGIQLDTSGFAGISGDSNQFMHQFEIADFRTPDFQVDAHADSSAPAVVANDLTVAADATYYAGGPLSDAPVDWQVRTAAASYAPPGWNGFTFGIWTPWWQTGKEAAGGATAGAAGGASSMSSGPCCDPVDQATVKVDKFSGRTDAAGHHFLQVRVGDLGKEFQGLPVTVTAQATVTDLNRQAVAGTTDLLVHPADYYVGLAGNDTFVTQGKDLAVQGIATDIDGAAAPGRAITVRAAKLTTSEVNGISTDTETSPQTCRVTSGAAPVTCTFKPSVAGTYRITATVVDDKGRISRSELTRWVAGPDGAVDSSVQVQQLTLVPDKKEYQPGESARLLVQSPIRSGNGLITVLHNGIVTTTRFPVADGSAVVPIPITEAEIPGITASVEIVGTAHRTSDGSAASGTPRPAYATGDIGLTVSTRARTLTVTAVPRQSTVTPGGSTTVDVTVTDGRGKPVTGSEFELVVADEAVLALGGYQLPDPLEAFYPELPDPLQAVYGRSMIMLANPPPQEQRQNPVAGVAASSAASSGAAAAAAPVTQTSRGLTDSAASAPQPAPDSPPGQPIAQRQNFNALALFVPSATTDANGHATVAVALPDSLTRYRVMVVAVAGDDQFGSAESTITAGLPLTVRPSAPRFLNFGDTFELPVLVQNQTDAPLSTDVVIQGANLSVTGPVGREVTVPARGRIEVRFPVTANQAGTAKFRTAAVSGAASDAVSVELPVYTPTTTETFASYGILQGGTTVLQRLTAPTGVVSQFGGLQIDTSSTALQQLTDAVGYLAAYDYDSSDGLAAQIIAIGSLDDVLTAFSAPGLPSPNTLKALVASDVTKLVALQNDDGGFPYWQHGDKSDPFNSIESTQALLVAAHRGFVVPPDSISRAQQYLAAIGSHLPAAASQSTRDTVRAYALNVQMLGGHRDAAAAQALVTQRGNQLALDAVAWLLPVVTDTQTRAALERRVENAAVDDAGSATFTNAVTGDAWTTLQSDRRTDGLVLDALISVQPTSDLIPKIVAGLMAGQTEGRWANVQENAFILLALRHYYDAYESTSADFVASVWLGDRFAGQHQFRGHTTERATASIPTSALLDGEDDDVTVQNKGTGRLYYRLGLQTAPTSSKLAPLDRGFVVSRTYQGVDHPADVTRDAAGTWHIKAGARVRVQLELVSRSAQSHVALIDPLPAGLENLNPELATTSKDLDPKSAGSATPGSWYGTWYDHQNLRNDRAEAFATYLPGGVYDYSYPAKATTDGNFIAPPSRAEQIYAPETFGRGASDRVVVGG